MPATQLLHLAEGAEISALDAGIIVVYFVIVLGIGLWVARNTTSGEDLFLAGRSLKWHSIGFSLFASNISSTTLIGLAGAAYTWGIAVSNYEWMAALVLAFFAIFMVPLYLKTRISTIPELLEKRFDRRSRVYFSGLTILANVIVDTAGGLYAGALVLEVFFPSLRGQMTLVCVGLAVVAGLYTAAGGLAAVVYTDVIQAIVLMVGSIILAWIAFGKLDYSWARIAEGVPEQNLSLMLPLDDPNLPWLGTLTGVPILGFYFWCTNQYIVQRVLGAKDVQHARWGSLLGGLLKVPVLFFMVIPGVMAAILFPNLTKGDQVFPTMVIELLPAGIMGIVLAGLIAAIMSSVDSTLNSASALVTLDFIKPRYPDMTPERTATVGRITIVIFMIVSALFAPTISNFEGLFNYLQVALSYLMPPVAAVFFLGIFWPRGTATAAFVALLGSHAVSAGLLAINVIMDLKAAEDPTAQKFPIHFTLVALILFVVSAAIFVGVSLAGEPPTKEQAEITYQATPEPESEEPQPAWANPRLLAALLVVFTLVIVGIFW